MTVDFAERFAWDSPPQWVDKVPLEVSTQALAPKAMSLYAFRY